MTEDIDKSLVTEGEKSSPSERVEKGDSVANVDSAANSNIDVDSSSADIVDNNQPLAHFSEVAQGFRKRTLVTAKLSTKLTAKLALEATKNKIIPQMMNAVGLEGQKEQLSQLPEKMETVLGMDVPNEEEKARKKTASAVDSAWNMYSDMDQLKGLVMKFGQMASYLGTHKVPEAQRVLAKLQSEASALPYAQVKQILTAELKQPVDELFTSFEHEALAAASIGQVHKAEYQDQTLALKVQYPGVEEAIHSDLKLIENFSPLASVFRRMLTVSVDTEELKNELVERVLEECDYTQEAKNQQLAHEIWKEDGHIYIPYVVPALSTRHVLASEFMEGQHFYDFKDSATQEEKNKAANTLYRMSTESVFNYCFFNGDPHPGNYLFGRDGRVVFLDFGCTVKFSRDFVQHWKGMVKAALEFDLDNFKKNVRLMGFVGNEKKFDWGYQWEYVNYTLQPIKENKPFTYSKEYSEFGDELLLYRNQNKLAGAFPRQLLFASRLQYGLVNILVDLNATINGYDVFRDAVYGSESAVFDK